MQWKESRLGEESDGHQRSGDKCRGFHMNPAGEQHDVERCIAAVEQGRSDQIEDRAEQGEQLVGAFAVPADDARVGE